MAYDVLLFADPGIDDSFAIMYYPEIHGPEGLGPIKPPDTLQDVEVHDINKILEIINEYKDNLIIVNVGRLTELALMFILYGNDVLKDVTPRKR
ncbi:hypothetical protein [Neobacillus niacini]|uniref:hypothetical protein n=1 Tax=Neobacillus niacini TaxID=86668 RepID=UPI0005EFA3FF|nr:hypothetical protein [Neobacillus niacini]